MVEKYSLQIQFGIIVNSQEKNSDQILELKIDENMYHDQKTTL